MYSDVDLPQVRQALARPLSVCLQKVKDVCFPREKLYLMLFVKQMEAEKMAFDALS